MSNDHYQTLEVSKDASEDEIRKSFKKLSLKYHPDRNPNGIDGLSKEECEEKYKSIVEAHSILTDTDKKRNYDLGGMRNQDHNFNPFGGAAGNMFNMFGNLFGVNLNFGNSPQIIQKVINITITLEDVFKGYQSQKNIKIENPCGSCSSTGKTEIKNCESCNGSGKKKILQRIGPSMMVQQIISCDNCKEKGKIGSGDNCNSCDGKGIEEKIISIPIHFPPGILEGGIFKHRYQQIEFHFVANIKSHSYFSRQGDNLILNKDISLLQALTGTQFPLKLLNDREIMVKITEGEIIKPNTTYILRNLGINGGHILINFNIHFPDTLTSEQIKSLREGILEENTKEYKSDDKEVYYIDKL